jgi:hypothetical protein
MAVNRADKQYLDHVWPWDVRDFDGESYVTRLGAVQRSAAQAWADVHNTHERHLRDQTKNDAHKLLSSAKFAKAAMEHQRAEFEDARVIAKERLKATKDTLQRALNPPSDPGEAVLYGEIRQAARAMPVGARLKLAYGARDAGTFDPRLLHALTSGPDALALLPPTHHGEFRDTYLQHAKPVEYGRALRIASALQHAEEGQRQLEAHAKKIIDFDMADAIQRSAV